MVVGDVVLRTVGVFLTLLCDAVDDIGLAEECIALVLFVGEYRAYGGFAPRGLSGRRESASGFELVFDGADAVAFEEPIVYHHDRFGFFGDDFGFSVCTFSIAEEILVADGYIAFLGAFLFAPFHVAA